MPLCIPWPRIDTSQVGLDVEESARPLNRAFKRPDVEKTITQTIHSIAYVLSEIENLRRKYDLQPSSPDPRGDSENSKHSRSWKSFSSLFVTSPTKSVLQERMLENQKQKSFLAIAKWASVDARKFEEKIKALKSLIDGLESISKAAGVITPPPKEPLDLPAVPDENPPPYTTILRPRPTRSATEPSRTMTSRQTSPSVAPLSAVLRKHMTAMKSYLAEHPENANTLRKPREKLAILSESQVEELINDVHDELIRRKALLGSPDHLPETPSFHPKRNQARKKFGSFPEPRFQDLVGNLVAEMEKRYPVLVEKSPSTSTQTLAPVHDSRSRSRTRSQTAPSSHQPSIENPTTTTTNLKRAQSNSAQKSSSSSSSDLKCHGSTPTTPGTQKMETIFKSFRVGINDPTSEILPAALQKYNIDGPSENYSLYISYASESGGADVQRPLGLDEKPLMIFKKLNEAGQKPSFMLRKRERKDL